MIEETVSFSKVFFKVAKFIFFSILILLLIFLGQLSYYIVYLEIVIFEIAY